MLIHVAGHARNAVWHDCNFAQQCCDACIAAPRFGLDCVCSRATADNVACSRLHCCCCCTLRFSAAVCCLRMLHRIALALKPNQAAALLQLVTTSLAGLPAVKRVHQCNVPSLLCYGVLQQGLHKLRRFVVHLDCGLVVLPIALLDLLC